jgi:hypothetical protein
MHADGVDSHHQHMDAGPATPASVNPTANFVRKAKLMVQTAGTELNHTLEEADDLAPLAIDTMRSKIITHYGKLHTQFRLESKVHC